MVNTRHHRKTYGKHRNAKVHNKTKKNASSTIVGVVHAHWCGHCQELMPKWKLFKNELKHNKNITVLDIEDGDPRKDHKLSRLNVKINDKSVRIQANGFPTIFKIQHGHLEYYSGNRDPVALKQWALASKAPVVKHNIMHHVKKPSSGLFGLF